MREPPATSISEPQLLALLASGERTISAADLINWRKNGLLPPLTSHGVGIGKGKVHCWHEPDIVVRAELVHDAIHRYGRNDMVLLTLFLSGFAVPLPQLRRAWAFRCKLRKAPTIRPALVSARPSGAQSGDPLLQAAMAVGAAVETDHHLRMTPLLERALARLGYPKCAANASLLRMMMAMEAALDRSDLVQAASNDEVRQAQHHLSLALNFLRDCAAEEEKASLTAMFGPALFAFILTLLRSGQGAVLERATMRIAESIGPASSEKTLHFPMPGRQAQLRASGFAAP